MNAPLEPAALTDRVSIRRLAEADLAEWLRMRRELWPDCGDAMHDLEMQHLSRDPGTAVFVAAISPSSLEGFVETSIRTWAEACHSGRVAYIEGWYVSPSARGRGVGRALMAAAEQWARDEGCHEIASDTDIENVRSVGAHRRLGFEIVGRLTHFRKALEAAGARGHE